MNDLSQEDLVHVTLAIMRHINVNIVEGDFETVKWVSTALTKYSLGIMVKFVEATKRDEVWRAAKAVPPMYTDKILDIKEIMASQKLYILQKFPQLSCVMPATSTTKIKKSKKSVKKSAKKTSKKFARKSAKKFARKSTKPSANPE